MSSRLTTSSDAEVSYTKATRLELDGNFDGAFQLYIKSAEEHLRLSNLIRDATSRERHKADARKALQRAENIKAKKQDSITPVAKDYLSQGEQLSILRKSSVVHGLICPIWAEETSERTDLSQPRLSAEQVQQSASWRQLPEDEYVLYNAEDPSSPQDVVQHVISDCSLCASVAVCIEHNRRFGSKLAISDLYPQNSNGLPVRSPSGMHSLRVLLNGSHRKANLDDKLPSYPDGKLMCMSSGSKHELWPSIIEKAYMKLMGGYDFPGSLSTTDLYILTGWIPETVEILSPGFERERTWKRILAAFSEGRCMLTVGTGRVLPAESLLPLKLQPAHCYAVTDVTDNGEDRRITILDNWVSRTHQGHDNAADLAMQNLSLEGGEDEHSPSCDVSWDTVCTVFDGLFLSWDPAMFNQQSHFHGMWKKDSEVDSALPRNFHIRLAISGSEEADVWLLLSRHIVSLKREAEYIAMSAQIEDEISPSDLSMKGSYTNNPHVLVKMRCVGSVLSIAASYDGVYDDVGFTISAYASSPISWVSSIQDMLYGEKIVGALTSKSAGGNPSLPTYMNNPQYHLRIHPDKSIKKADGSTTKSRLSLSLSGDRRVPFNVSIVWSQGQRVTDLARSDVASSTGPYRYGHASTVKALPPGDYTLIVSAFDVGKIGAYHLKIDCSTRIDVKTIAQEGSGMFSKTIRGSWDAETAGGGPSFNKYTSNPVFALKLPTQSQVKTRLQLLNRGPTIALNVTIFRATSRHTLGPHVATSGPYSDAVSGVVTPQVNLSEGTYFVIPSTFSPGTKASFKLLVYTSAPGVKLEPTTLGAH